MKLLNLGLFSFSVLFQEVFTIPPYNCKDNWSQYVLDKCCFDKAFGSNLPKSPTSKASVIIQIHHIRKYAWFEIHDKGPLIKELKSKTTNVFRKNFTLPANVKRVYKLRYIPAPGFANFNPRNLTLYYDSQKGMILAAIGHLVENTIEKFERHYCSSDTLTKENRQSELTLNSKRMKNFEENYEYVDLYLYSNPTITITTKRTTKRTTKQTTTTKRTTSSGSAMMETINVTLFSIVLTWYVSFISDKLMSLSMKQFVDRLKEFLK